MTANVTPIFPVTPLFSTANLCAVTACATRGPVASANLATNNIIQMLASQTSGFRLDEIQVKASSTSMTAATAAMIVGLWAFDGTTAWLIDEILVTAVTPSTTVASFVTNKYYTTRVFPSVVSLYVSTSVTTTASTTALIVEAFGGAY